MTLSLTGIACFTGCTWDAFAIAAWLSNAALASELPLLGVFLAFTLVGGGVRNRDGLAQGAHVAARHLCRRRTWCARRSFVVPALRRRQPAQRARWRRGVRRASRRGDARRTSGASSAAASASTSRSGAISSPTRCRSRWPSASTSCRRTSISGSVATRFDAATFAIYAVGCLQIPLVDLVCTSTGNVMMVQMAELARDGDRRHGARAVARHDGEARVDDVPAGRGAAADRAQRDRRCCSRRPTLASVPMFMVWCLMILPSAFAVDGVLRVYAQTRFLLVMNIVRLRRDRRPDRLVHLDASALIGAVLVTLVGTTIVKAAAHRADRPADARRACGSAAVEAPRLIRPLHAAVAVVAGVDGDALSRDVRSCVTAALASRSAARPTRRRSWLIWYLRVMRAFGRLR